MGSRAPLGLIAGAGLLPLEFIRSARSRDVPVPALLIRGAASTSLEKKAPQSRWVSVGQLGAMISFFKERGVRQAVMLGKVQHSVVLRDPRLDWRAIRLLARLKDRSGETVLKGVAGELGKEGIRLLDSREGMGHCLARRGEDQGRPDPKGRDWVLGGLAKARLLAREGIGQSILIKRGAVAAVEGPEGTDEAIRRAGFWAGKGCVLVKAASPRQDWRFDVPTIGPGTFRALAKAKAAGLVIEGGKCFILEKRTTYDLARSLGLFLKVL